MRAIILLGFFVALAVFILYKKGNKKKNVIIAIAMQEEGIHFEQIIKEFQEDININVVYTGIGLVNASYSLTKEIMKYKSKNNMIDYIINLGSSGGRGKKVNVGDVVECSGFIAKDADQRALGFPLGIMDLGSQFLDDRVVIIENKNTITGLDKKICCSGNSFDTKESPFKECEVVEMEAVALAKIALRENIKFTAIKYISDVLGKSHDHNEGIEFRDNVKKTSKALLEELKKILVEIKNN